jgi:hypothetical protein
MLSDKSKQDLLLRPNLDFLTNGISLDILEDRAHHFTRTREKRTLVRISCMSKHLKLQEEKSVRNVSENSARDGKRHLNRTAI